MIRSMMSSIFCLAFIAALVLVGSSAQATVIGTTNGGFETQAVANTAVAHSVTSWFESSTASTGPTAFNDWLYRNSGIFTADTNVLGFSGTPGNGYIYQAIGTYTANEIVQVTGTAMKRSGAGGVWGAITVSLLSGNFAGADGTPLSATLLDSASFTAAGLGLPNNTTAASAPFTANLNSGNAGVGGTTLWLLITPNNPASTETFLDNLQAVTIPEPTTSSALLLGSLGLLVARRRRRRCGTRQS